MDRAFRPWVALFVALTLSACSPHEAEKTTSVPPAETEPPPSPQPAPDVVPPPEGEPPALVGTAWVAEFIEGVGKLDNRQSTLEFLPEASAAGGAGCNRFGGSVEISGDAIRFGPIRATKMACEGGLMTQEQKFLDALAAVKICKMKDHRLVLADDAGVERVRLAINNTPQN